MRRPPCKKLVDGIFVDCKERCLGCHSTCKKYAEYDEQNIQDRKQRLLDLELQESDQTRWQTAAAKRKAAYMRSMKRRQDEREYMLHGDGQAGR